MLFTAAIWLLSLSLLVLFSNSQSIDPNHGKREFTAVFPRIGESVYVDCSMETKECFGDIMVAGYLACTEQYAYDVLIPNKMICLSSLNTHRKHYFHFKVFDEVSTIDIAGSGSLISFRVSVLVPTSAMTIPLSFRVEDADTGEILHQSSLMTLAVIHPSDLGLQLLQSSISFPDTVPVLDFIELGTSIFETATQAADAMIKAGNISTIHGIAVDAVRQYIAGLPAIEGCLRLNAGMSLSESDAMVTVYYLPQSVIYKAKLNHNMMGTTSVGIIDVQILDHIGMGFIPPEVVQKAYIPALTASKLLSKALSLPGRRLRLLKTDLEGMDQPILHQVLNFYEKRTGTSLITSEHPCVVYFELGNRDEALFDRFTSVGFVEYRGLVDVKGNPSTYDAMMVNCLCTREDFKIALALLAPDIIEVDSVISICYLVHKSLWKTAFLF